MLVSFTPPSLLSFHISHALSHYLVSECSPILTDSYFHGVTVLCPTQWSEAYLHITQNSFAVLKTDVRASLIVSQLLWLTCHPATHFTSLIIELHTTQRLLLRQLHLPQSSRPYQDSNFWPDCKQEGPLFSDEFVCLCVSDSTSTL